MAFDSRREEVAACALVVSQKTKVVIEVLEVAFVGLLPGDLVVLSRVLAELRMKEVMVVSAQLLLGGLEQLSLELQNLNGKMSPHQLLCPRLLSFLVLAFLQQKDPRAAALRPCHQYQKSCQHHCCFAHGLLRPELEERDLMGLSPILEPAVLPQVVVHHCHLMACLSVVPICRSLLPFLMVYPC